MARDNADQSQWNGRHYDARQPEVAKFHHHQHVNQDQSRTEGEPHIAEGFICNSPFTGPFETRFEVIVWWTNDAAGKCDAVWCFVIFQQLRNFNHAIDRRAQPAGNFASDIFDRAQVLVKNRLVLWLTHELTQVGQRHQSVVSGLNWYFTKACKLPAYGKRRLQRDKAWLQLMADFDGAQFVAAHDHGQLARNVFDRDVLMLSFLLVDGECPGVVFVNEIVIDIDDDFGLFENLGDIASDLPARFCVRTIDLGNHGLQDWWTGRHFDNFNIEAIFLSEGR